jgi:hypothetical protein
MGGLMPCGQGSDAGEIFFALFRREAGEEAENFLAGIGLARVGHAA